MQGEDKVEDKILGKYSKVEFLVNVSATYNIIFLELSIHFILYIKRLKTSLTNWYELSEEYYQK